jgi:hypothetical protein
MAELLKRQYGLIALKAWLDTYTSEDGPRVRLALEAKVDGVLQTLREWTLTTNEIGLPERMDWSAARGRGPDYRLPDSMMSELESSLTDACKGDERRPLWLHLVKPYGDLGLVPWERLLSQRLNVPILRLPDFIVPPPLESHRTLDIVLCSSAPAAKDAFSVPAYVSRMAMWIVEAVPRHVRLHVFVDVDAVGELRRQLDGMDLGVRVKVYSPAEAEFYTVQDSTSRIVDPTGRITSPWLLWIRDVLKGQSIDVVHFLSHGYFANEGGSLAMSESPVRNYDPRMARFIGPSELIAFLTQVGAWAVGLSSPPNNFSEVGSRALADSIGQMRPGSVLHHDFETDLLGRALVDAYRFLFSPEPERPPVSPSVFMYCQPHRVAGAAAQQDFLAEMFPPEFLPDDPEIRAFGASMEEDEEVPAWVAASQRFIEQAKMQLSRNVRSGQTRGRGTDRSLEAEGDNLRQLQGIVARVAREMKSEGKK